MYDELIKTLRLRAALWEKMYDEDNVLKQAADAIEDLSRDLDSMNEANIALYGALPKWIPVTERLPDVFKHVLVNIPGMAPHPTVQEAFREKNGMWYSNGFQYGADEITHWMPLPERPKEE